MTRIRIGLAVTGVCALLMMPTIALAARLATITASPLTLTAGVSSSVDLSVTDNGSISSGGDEIGCVSVSMPAGFTVSSASIVSIGGASSGTRWLAWQATTFAQAVAFSNPSDKLRLKGGETAILRVVGVASSAGPMSWPGIARNHSQVTGTTCVGSGIFTLVQTMAFTVVPSLILPTPTAAPTSTPSPTPSASSSSIPLPTASLPISLVPSPSVPIPSAVASLIPPLGTPPPSGPATPTASPAPSRSDSPAPGVLVPSSPTAGGGAGPGQPAAPVAAIGPGGFVVRTSFGGGAGMALGDLIPTIGDAEWFVPGAVLGVPGLLVLLWVALQLAAGIAWVPAAKRLRGNDRRQRRRVTVA